MIIQSLRVGPMASYLFKDVVPQNLGEDELPGAHQLVDELAQYFENIVDYVRNAEIDRNCSNGLIRRFRFTHVSSLTTRTSSEKDSFADFCFWSFTWQLKVVYRWMSLLVRSSGWMNVRKVVMNASPNAVGRRNLSQSEGQPGSGSAYRFR